MMFRTVRDRSIAVFWRQPHRGVCAVDSVCVLGATRTVLFLGDLGFDPRFVLSDRYKLRVIGVLIAWRLASDCVDNTRLLTADSRGTA
jgi:hypothetical protein